MYHWIKTLNYHFWTDKIVLLENKSDLIIFRYNDLMKVLKKNVTEACDYLDNNFATEFAPASRPHQHTPNVCHQSSEILFSDGESSFGESSLNQVGV